MTTQAWPHLKAYLRDLSSDHLLDLLRDLYTLHAESKCYLDVRFLAITPDQRPAPYRQLIERVFDPNDVINLDMAAVHAALADFAKTNVKPAAQIDRLYGMVPMG